MTNLLDLALKAATQTLEPFIAPVLEPGSYVWTVQQGIPYRFRARADPGWWRLEINRYNEATPTRPAWIDEIGRYLRGLHSQSFITVRPITDNVYECMRIEGGWAWGNYLVYLCNGRFGHDVIEAVPIGSNYVFSAPSFRLPPLEAWLSAARERIAIYREEADKREIERARKERAKPVEARIQDALSFMGATLTEAHSTLRGWSVTYSYRGSSHTVYMAEEGHMESVGICISGADRDQTLESTVAVIEGSDQYEW